MQWPFVNWIIIICYLLGFALLGYVFSKKQQSAQYYFTANGKIPTFIAACSIYATMLSSISYLAIPALIYATNWTNGIAALSNMAVAITVAYIFVPFVRRLNITTAYEYLGMRFGRGLQLVGASSFVLFQIIRIAIVVYLPTLALMEVLPDVDPTYIVLITSLICVIYTSIGGIEGVVWGDFLQTIILVSGALTIIYFGFSSVPEGIPHAFRILSEQGKMFPKEVFSFDFTQTTVWAILIGAYFNTIYDYIGNQATVQRFVVVKNLREAQKALFMNVPLLFVSIILFIGMGSAIYLFYQYNPLPELERADAILPYMIIHALPPVLSGFVIAALLAAAHSTVSSSLNSLATCVIVDILDPSNQFSDRKKLFVVKLVSWIMGFVSIGCIFLLLQYGYTNMFLYIQTVTAMLGGPISTVFLIGIFFSKATAIAAWGGFFTSLVVALFLTNPLGVMTLIFPSYIAPVFYAFVLPIIIIGGGVIAGGLISLLSMLFVKMGFTPPLLFGKGRS